MSFDGLIPASGRLLYANKGCVYVAKVLLEYEYYVQKYLRQRINGQ